jgi:farnesyl diphosphate synthase
MLLVGPVTAEVVAATKQQRRRRIHWTTLAFFWTLGISQTTRSVAAATVGNPHAIQTLLASSSDTATVDEETAILPFVDQSIMSSSSISRSSTVLSAAAGVATGLLMRAAWSVFQNVRNQSSKKVYPLQEMAATSSERDEFLCLYPVLRHEFLAHLRQAHELNQDDVTYLGKMLDYNVPGGKLNRGTTVLTVAGTLRNLSPTQRARAAVLGWSLEFLQAFFLVADDVMDASVSRRGQPCWYQLPDVQLIAINDSFLLESAVFLILKQHFGEDPFYLDLVHLMLDVIQKTEVGQLLDLTSQPPIPHHPHGHNVATKQEAAQVDLTRFTLDRYRRIVKYKTAYYSFYLPVAMGMLLSGLDMRRHQTAFGTAQDICVNMGEYFQIQDDYLDCYGDPAVIGKIGTDIQDNKCSWLVVQALERCSPDQRETLQVHYGQSDPASVAAVKAIYQELDMPKIFSDYEESSYQAIQRQLDTLDPTVLPRQVFELFLQKIYKRSK